MSAPRRKNTGAAGAARERQVVQVKRDQGYLAFRVGGTRRRGTGAADDFSVCDVVAMRAVELDPEAGVGPVEILGLNAFGHFLKPLGQREQTGPWSLVEFIEVKANVGSPFKSFLPDDRTLLRLAARAAGATPWLCHWPPRGEPRWIPADDWPE